MRRCFMRHCRAELNLSRSKIRLGSMEVTTQIGRLNQVRYDFLAQQALLRRTVETLLGFRPRALGVIIFLTFFGWFCCFWSNFNLTRFGALLGQISSFEFATAITTLGIDLRNFRFNFRITRLIYLVLFYIITSMESPASTSCKRDIA